jgi:hypothetical protein
MGFLFASLTPEPLPLGTAGVPVWRVGPPAEDPSTDITYAPKYGGPFATPRLLVTRAADADLPTRRPLARRRTALQLDANRTAGCR